MELVDFELVRGPLDGDMFTFPAEPWDPPEVLWMADASAIYVRGAPCTCTGKLRWLYIHEEAL